MKAANFTMELVSKLIFKLLPEKENLTLIMDRTNWKFGEVNINILMIGISYKNVAIPLLFKMLDKQGNSHTEERIALMEKFISWFGVNCIDCLLADREFVGDNWIGFLNEHRIRYFICIRENFLIFCPKKNKKLYVWNFFNNLKPYQGYHYDRIMQYKGEYCYLSGVKTIENNGKIGYCILISFNKSDEGLEKYKERWQIETLFKGLKSSGFNVEDTHLRDLERIERLMLLVMIAFVWCYKVGDYIDTHLKAIRIKPDGKRVISVFKCGLDYLSEYLFREINKFEINYLQFLSYT